MSRRLLPEDLSHTPADKKAILARKRISGCGSNLHLQGVIIGVGRVTSSSFVEKA